jgi:hypothetical protein
MSCAEVNFNCQRNDLITCCLGVPGAFHEAMNEWCHWFRPCQLDLEYRTVEEGHDAYLWNRLELPIIFFLAQQSRERCRCQNRRISYLGASSFDSCCAGVRIFRDTTSNSKPCKIISSALCGLRDTMKQTGEATSDDCIIIRTFYEIFQCLQDLENGLSRNYI